MYLTIKVPVTTTVDGIHNIFIVVFWENEAWYFEWMVSLATDTLNVKPYFLRKMIIKYFRMSSAIILNGTFDMV